MPTASTPLSSVRTPVTCADELTEVIAYEHRFSALVHEDGSKYTAENKDRKLRVFGASRAHALANLVFALMCDIHLESAIQS